MQIQPYLFFAGRCEEAIGYYQKTLGAKVNFLMRFKESPDPIPPNKLPPGWEDKIMHGSLQVGHSTLLLSDGQNAGQPDFRGISLTLSVDSDEQAKLIFTRLAQNGQINMPLGATFFASSFGMLTDYMGVTWMIIAGQK
ncbi:MAG: VOC family protein [Proteobacteria bacterium]|nr:VOC family protein [Pseudomonadota bacterium]